MDKIDRSRIENNSLKEEIERLLEFCKKERLELGDSYFGAPIDEDEISSWERETGITIPESYKEWLRFSGECELIDSHAVFWGPKKFNSDLVPDDFVTVGEIIGDCEFICFSKEGGYFVKFFEGRVFKEYESFKGVINAFIELFGPMKISPERMEEILKKLNE